MVTYQQIKIDGSISFQMITHLRIVQEANQHGIAEVEGMISVMEPMETYLQKQRQSIIAIKINESKRSKEDTIFAGYIQDGSFKKEFDTYRVRLKLASCSILLDQQLINRSFQDTSLTYGDIAELTAMSVKSGYVLCTAGDNRRPERPVIQYQESNWQFIKRMASHLGTMVYPEIKLSRPALWLGMPNSNQTVLLSPTQYDYGISNQYYEWGGKDGQFEFEDFFYCNINCDENYSIGMKATINHRTLTVIRKEIQLEQGRLKFAYQLGHPISAALRSYANPVFYGMSILGTVLSTAGETVKVHLDIDETQDESTAYSYEWTPDTGSVMYCMPTIGTKVSLYFADGDERGGRVTSCVRTNGSLGGAGKPMSMSQRKPPEGQEPVEPIPAMGNPNQKCLSTEDGKLLSLDEETVELSNVDGDFILLQDDAEIAFDSTKKLFIEAEGKITFQGKNIRLETPTELKFSK